MQEEQLKRIQNKLNLLLKRYSAIQQENSKLKEALDAAQKKNIAQEESMEKLKQQVDILKFSSAAMDDGEKKEFEKRINAYLKEIDKCIVMLGK